MQKIKFCKTIVIFIIIVLFSTKSNIKSIQGAEGDLVLLSEANLNDIPDYYLDFVKSYYMGYFAEGGVYQCNPVVKYPHGQIFVQEQSYGKLYFYSLTEGINSLCTPKGEVITMSTMYKRFGLSTTYLPNPVAPYNVGQSSDENIHTVDKIVDQDQVDLPNDTTSNTTQNNTPTQNTLSNTNDNMYYPTKEEIIKYYKSSNVNLFNAPKTTYVKEPTIKGTFNAGIVSENDQQNALKTLNFFRYVAGLPSDVKLDSVMTQKAQAGSLVLYALNQLTHTPSKPSGMPEDLYKAGYAGTSSSNLAWNYPSITSSIFGYVDEDGELGHRRWVFSPNMGYTGFGYAGTYSAMYTFDHSVNLSFDNIHWPSNNTPTEIFNAKEVWSVSVSKDYDSLKSSNINIEIIRKNDNKTWTINNPQISTINYGNSPCIIFTPDNITDIKDGDQYDVNITVLTKKNTPANISYTVNFFDLEPITKIDLSDSKLTLKKGEYKNLTATTDGAKKKTLLFSSSDTSIISVDSNGQLKAIAPGSALITVSVKDSNINTTCAITVLDTAKSDSSSKPNSTNNQTTTSTKNNNQITVQIDGKQISFDVQPQNISGRVMVPMRTIFEELGATVLWDQSTKKIISTKDDKTIIMQINSNSMYINGKLVQPALDVPPQLVNSKTLVPIRAVAESFGSVVEWDGVNQIVSIQSN